MLMPNTFIFWLTRIRIPFLFDSCL